MAGTQTLVTLFEGGSFFLCLRWPEGRWWVADCFRRAVYSYGPEGDEQLAFAVNGQPSAVGWLPDDDLLVVSMKDRRLLRRSPDGVLETHSYLSAVASGPLKDMAVDSQGRAFVGDLGCDQTRGGDRGPARVLRSDLDGAASVVADELWCPGGIVITDAGTLIVAEAKAMWLTAFDIQPDGSLSNRRVWAEVAIPLESAGTGFAPDGCALDAKGHVWAADALGGKVCRLAEGGEIVDEVAMPDGLGVVACGLGGEEGRTLIACAAPDFDERARSAARDAVLLTTTVEVPAKLAVMRSWRR